MYEGGDAMRAIRWVLALLIVLHGQIHVMGFMGAWGLGDVRAQIGVPIVSLEGVSLHGLGIVWLVACLGLLASAILLALGRQAWEPLALVRAVLSQIAILFWWPSAWRGTLANMIILMVIAWHVTRHGRAHTAVRDDTRSSQVAEELSGCRDTGIGGASRHRARARRGKEHQACLYS